MLLRDGWRNAELLGCGDFRWLKSADRIAQIIEGNGADDNYGVGEGPTSFAGIEFVNLCIDGLHVRAANKAGEYFAKGVDPGMVGEIAADRAEVIVAIEEGCDGEKLRFGLRSESAFRASHLDSSMRR